MVSGLHPWWRPDSGGEEGSVAMLVACGMCWLHRLGRVCRQLGCETPCVILRRSPCRGLSKSPSGLTRRRPGVLRFRWEWVRLLVVFRLLGLLAAFMLEGVPIRECFLVSRVVERLGC